MALSEALSMRSCSTRLVARRAEVGIGPRPPAARMEGSGEHSTSVNISGSPSSVMAVRA